MVGVGVTVGCPSDVTNGGVTVAEEGTGVFVGVAVAPFPPPVAEDPPLVTEVGVLDGTADDELPPEAAGFVGVAVAGLVEDDPPATAAGFVAEDPPVAAAGLVDVEDAALLEDEPPAAAPGVPGFVLEEPPVAGAPPGCELPPAAADGEPLAVEALPAEGEPAPDDAS